MEFMKLNKKQIAPVLKSSFPEYKGRKFKVVFTPNCYLFDTNWSGGSKSSYVFLTADLKAHTLPSFAPWNNPIEGREIQLNENFIVVEHSFFCGQDSGITIHAHPCYAPLLLPA